MNGRHQVCYVGRRRRTRDHRVQDNNNTRWPRSVSSQHPQSRTCRKSAHTYRDNRQWRPILRVLPRRRGGRLRSKLRSSVPLHQIRITLLWRADFTFPQRTLPSCSTTKSTETSGTFSMIVRHSDDEIVPPLWALLIQVIIDGSLEALFECVCRLPAERFDFLGFERVTLVVACTVVNELDQIFIRANDI